MAMIKYTEEQIETRVCKYLESEYPVIKRQVKLHSKRVDLVYRNDKGKLIGIEIKISNWREALQQAWTNKLACHESYVALWHEYAHRADENLFKTAGVGLLVVDSDFTLRKVVKPSKRHSIHRQIHKNVLQYVSS